MYCLEVSDLYKSYGQVEAVKGISFKIKSGLCFGILGANGAGKSTTIEILEGIKNPTKGKILYKGKPRDKNYKESIGIQFQNTALQDYMTVREALVMFAALYKESGDVDKVIQACDLKDILDRDHNHLSGGQRKKLLLALSLINNPDLIFLDEPTTGLDPSARRSFWNLVKNIKKQGKTVILTTHYMDEAYILCDEIIIVHQGRIVAQGVPQELLLKYFKGTRIMLPLKHEKKISLNSKGSWVQSDHSIEIKIDNMEKTISHLLSIGIPIQDIEVRPYRLDDLFLHLTGEISTRDPMENL